MTTPPLVTIVTPSLNQGRFIRAAIESVLSQDYEHLEYIVMDGGSTDETAAVASDYASRLTFISEPDRGQSHAVNKGFRLARGSIVAWLNSDDIYLPAAIRAAVDGLSAHPAAGAVYGEGYLMDECGAAKRRFPPTQPFDQWKLIHVSDYILQQTVFFRKNVLDEIGLLDEDLHYVMDWDVLIRIGKRYELACLPEYMACLREYPQTKSSAGGAQRIAEIGRLMRRHAGRRFTPGYIAYALEFYKPVWCNWIQLHGLPRPAERCITLAANLAIGRANAARAGNRRR